ncbi:MAG: hypothetical protein Q8Q49_06065 [bacterium]|nr:hypothetical protein [bacterium]
MIVALENAEESSRVSFRQEGSTNNFVELNVLLGRNGYLPVDSGKAHYGYSEAKRLVEEANPDILVIA